MVYQGMIYGPPGWPAQEYMEALSDPAMRARDPYYRHQLCEYNPLLFGLVYGAESRMLMSHRNYPDRQPSVYLNEVHTDTARWGRRWARPNIGPEEERVAVCAPRASAKSTWMLEWLPLWAACFNHRKFIAMFGITTKAITRSHMVNLVGQIRNNDLLRHDFPTFCTPAPGTTATMSEYASDNGTRIVAAGIDEGVLGMNRNGTRPDTILFDDVDDATGKFSYATKDSRLATIRQGILGMDPNAVVGWTGTVPHRDSLVDDLVRHELGELDVEWVRQTKFRTRYYPAIITDRDGTQRSLWDVKWDLDYLLSRRGIHDFELNFMNRPPVSEGTLWNQDDFEPYGVPSTWRFSRFVLWVDPAVTDNHKSDFTGIAVVGFAENVRMAGVMMSGNLKVSPEGLKDDVRVALERFYRLGLREIMVESNQGGKFLRTALSGLDREFPGIRITLPRSSSSRGKGVEFAEAFSHYQQGRVRHSQQFRVAEDQMMRFPHTRNDDAGEAVVRGVNEILEHLPKLTTV